MASLPRVLCHRDFHVRNIMVKNGIQYLIDFQDARWGPLVYDVASLVKDSMSLDRETIDSVLLYYRQEIIKCDLPGHDKELAGAGIFPQAVSPDVYPEALKGPGYLWIPGDSPGQLHL